MLFCETVVKEEAGHERLVHLSCGMRKVRLPDRREELTLVVVKGFGEEPLMIMTNLAVRRSRKSVWHVIASYITRWRIEDVIRFIKQSYRLEDIRCLTYHRLQALMVLVTAVAYFAAVYLGLRMKLRGSGRPCPAGLEAGVRHPRLPPLRSGRRDQTVSLQSNAGTKETLGATGHSPCPANTLRSIIFWGNSSCF